MRFSNLFFLFNIFYCSSHSSTENFENNENLDSINKNVADVSYTVLESSVENSLEGGSNKSWLSYYSNNSSQNNLKSVSGEISSHFRNKNTSEWWCKERNNTHITIDESYEDSEIENISNVCLLNTSIESIKRGNSLEITNISNDKDVHNNDANSSTGGNDSFLNHEQRTALLNEIKDFFKEITINKDTKQDSTENNDLEISKSKIKFINFDFSIPSADLATMEQDQKISQLDKILNIDLNSTLNTNVLDDETNQEELVCEEDKRLLENEPLSCTPKYVRKETRLRRDCLTLEKEMRTEPIKIQYSGSKIKKLLEDKYIVSECSSTQHSSTQKTNNFNLYTRVKADKKNESIFKQNSNFERSFKNRNQSKNEFKNINSVYSVLFSENMQQNAKSKIYLQKVENKSSEINGKTIIINKATNVVHQDTSKEYNKKD